VYSLRETVADLLTATTNAAILDAASASIADMASEWVSRVIAVFARPRRS